LRTSRTRTAAAVSDCALEDACDGASVDHLFFLLPPLETPDSGRAALAAVNAYDDNDESEQLPDFAAEWLEPVDTAAAGDRALRAASRIKMRERARARQRAASIIARSAQSAARLRDGAGSPWMARLSNVAETPERPCPRLTRWFSCLIGARDAP